jgi:hypothetical protein
LRPLHDANAMRRSQLGSRGPDRRAPAGPIDPRPPPAAPTQLERTPRRRTGRRSATLAVLGSFSKLKSSLWLRF